MGAVVPGEYGPPPAARPPRLPRLGLLDCECCRLQERPVTRGADGPGLCTPACPVGTAVGGAGERREGWLGGWRASSGECPVTPCALLSAAGAVTYG